MSILKVNTIQDKGGNTIISSDGSGTLTLGNDALKASPMFYAYLSSSQTISSNYGNHKVLFDTEVFDTDNCYDNTTNYRFTPTVAGKYFIFASVNFDSSSNSQLETAYLRVYKNGSKLSEIDNTFSNNLLRRVQVNINEIVDMNGTTDYIEIYGAFVDSDTGTAPVFKGSSTNRSSKFGAYRIIGA